MSTERNIDMRTVKVMAIAAKDILDFILSMMVEQTEQADPGTPERSPGMAKLRSPWLIGARIYQYLC